MEEAGANGGFDSISVTSSAIPPRRYGLPVASRMAKARSRTQTTDPSGRTTRYSSSMLPSGSGRPAVSGVPVVRARPVHRLARYTWAFPTTLVGLTAGVLVLGTGGRAQGRRGALEGGQRSDRCK